MAGILRKNLESPDEVRSFEGGSGQLNLVFSDEGSLGRAVFEPGWQWSTHVKPIVKTDSCQVAHTGYAIAGRMRVEMNDGESVEFGPGDFMVIPPGHDAWVLGDEPCVLLDWQGFVDYARPG